MTLNTISTTALAMLLTSGCTVVVKDEASTLPTGTATTTTDADETADTSASDNGWTPSYFTTYWWQACVDGETQEASGFSVDGTDYDIIIGMMVMDESQANSCDIIISAAGPVALSKSSWAANFWAAFELAPGTYTIESDCDEQLGGSWKGIEETLASETWGFGVKELSTDAAAEGPAIYDWGVAEPTIFGSGWYLSKFDVSSEDAFAFAYEAEIDGACAGLTGDDGYLIDVLNTDVEMPTGGVHTGIYIQDFPLYVFSGADQLPF
jgi:hypothetical protein